MTGADAVVERLEIRGQFGSHALEALRLELQRLARRCGCEVIDIRIETHAQRRSD